MGRFTHPFSAAPIPAAPAGQPNRSADDVAALEAARAECSQCPFCPSVSKEVEAAKPSHGWLRVSEEQPPLASGSAAACTYKAGNMELGPAPVWDPTWLNLKDRGLPEKLEQAGLPLQMWAHYPCCVTLGTRHKAAVKKAAQEAADAAAAGGVPEPETDPANLMAPIPWVAPEPAEPQPMVTRAAGQLMAENAKLHELLNREASSAKKAKVREAKLQQELAEEKAARRQEAERAAGSTEAAQKLATSMSAELTTARATLATAGAQVSKVSNCHNKKNR